MKKLLREPLLHFLLLGLGLFVLHHFVAAPGDGSGERVVISRGKIQRLAAGFALMHQRAPAKDELDGLIAEAVREEILYREAKALGLDQDDTIVRRRLRQKLEFVSEDLAPASEPTEAQLQAYLASHLEQFRIETRYSFAQVYLDPQRHGRQLGADTAQLLSGLRRSGDAADLSQLGDSLLLQRQYEDIPARELERLFGAPFEAALRSVPTGQWQGPLPSGYGVHMVLLKRRDESRAPPLAEVRDAVRSQWLQSQRREANERFYAGLRERYEVIVEDAPPPTPRVGTAALAAESRP
jgi:hypothetical protein